jgi:hypothetical protein
MNETCGNGKVAVFAGRSGVDRLIASVTAMALIKKGNTFTDASFVSSTGWHGIIAPGLIDPKAIILSFKRGIEITTPERTRDTSNLGFTETTRIGLPAYTAYLDGGLCDYETLAALNSGEYDIVLFLEDGRIMGTRNSALVTKGFRGKIEVDVAKLPMVEDRQKSYPIWVDFSDLSEFAASWIANPAFTLTEALDYVPAGLNAVAIEVLTTTAPIKVTKRSDGSGYAGLLYTDAIVVNQSSSIFDVAVTILTDVTNGAYTATVVKNASGTPAALSGGEWVEIQFRHVASTYTDYISNVLRLTS